MCLQPPTIWSIYSALCRALTWRIHATPYCRMQEALPVLLKDTHITAMAQGNFTAQAAFEMASSVRKMLSDGA